MAESEIEKRAKRAEQRRESAIAAFQEYLSHNGDTLSQISTADPDFVGDLIGRLYPKGKLPKIRARLRSAGVNQRQFQDAISDVLDQSNDKMVQPGEKRLVATRLWTIFSKD